MARTRGGKRKIDDQNSHRGRGRLVEKRPFSAHRRFTKISQNNCNHLAMKFSMKVANHLLQQNLNTSGAKNAIISPLSLDMVLNIIALGSKGSTLNQLLRLFGCQDVEEFNTAVSLLGDVVRESKGDDEGPEIFCTNGLWVDQRYPLKKPFQEILWDLHKAEVKSVDFKNQPDEVVEDANLWVKKQSKGLIKQILSRGSIEEDTGILLANALYFKGTWVDKFKPENTKDKDFYLLNGEKVQVPFMSQSYTLFDYGTFEGCKVLRMLYNEDKVSEGEKARSFSMYIVLPEEKDGLPDLLGKIQMDSAMFLDNIKLDYERIGELAIPKFKFDCNLKIKETLFELGLTHPFDKNLQGITEMVESEEYWLCVDEIFQNSHIEVDEEGTKVVTFTRVTMLMTRAARIPEPPVNFIADHPFMFLIREDYSGAVLFVGTVLNPL